MIRSRSNAQRREILRNLAGLAGLTGLAAGAAATAAATFAPAARAQQTYPSHPVTIIVPWGPGGSGDITARTFGHYFEQKLGQTAVIDNRPGANGIIGSQFLKKAAPDGYTLMITSNMTHAANVSLYKDLPYDPLKDFTHVALFGVFGLVALVPPASPFKTIPELAAFSKAHPGEVNVGYFNASTQVAAEVLRVSGALPIKPVAYKAIGTALTDVLGGHIQMVFADYPAATSQIEAGKLIPIAVTAAQRSEQWPQVPAMAEFYPGYEVIASLGLAAPAGTPPPLVQRLNTIVADALKDPTVKAQLEKLGYTLRPISVEATREFLVEERGRWATYVKAASIEPQ